MCKVTLARRNIVRVRQDRPRYGVGDFHRAFHFRQPAHAQLIRDAFRRLEWL